MTISWKPPADDGGSPLTGYIIEMKEANRQYWSMLNKVAASLTSYLVQELRQNSEYDFRITAVNKIGHSDPLLSEVPTMAKSSLSK